MSIYSQFKTNKNCEENGIKIKFKANDDGSIPAFIIARAGRSNPLWLKTFEAKTRPFKKEIDEGLLSEADASKLNIDIFVTANLKGWENIQGMDGKTIPYSYDNAISFFSELPELFSTLNIKASDKDNFLEANLKADEKN